MSNLQQSKWVDLIDKFNGTYRYFDDTFTIDKTLNLLNIFQICIQQNFSWIKQILKTKNFFLYFLDLNIKVIWSNIHTSVCDKRDDWISHC